MKIDIYLGAIITKFWLNITDFKILNVLLQEVVAQSFFFQLFCLNNPSQIMHYTEKEWKKSWNILHLSV